MSFGGLITTDRVIVDPSIIPATIAFRDSQVRLKLGPGVQRVYKDSTQRLRLEDHTWFDGFDRPSSTSSLGFGKDGQNWTNQIGTMGLTGDGYGYVVALSSNVAYATFDPGTPDGTFRVDFVYNRPSFSGSINHQLIVRGVEEEITTKYYAVDLNITSGDVGTFRVIRGDSGVISSSTTGLALINGGRYTIQGVCSNDTITGTLLQGMTILATQTATDTTTARIIYRAGTLCGVRCTTPGGLDGDKFRFDNFGMTVANTLAPYGTIYDYFVRSDSTTSLGRTPQGYEWTRMSRQGTNFGSAVYGIRGNQAYVQTNDTNANYQFLTVGFKNSTTTMEFVYLGNTTNAYEQSIIIRPFNTTQWYFIGVTVNGTFVDGSRATQFFMGQANTNFFTGDQVFIPNLVYGQKYTLRVIAYERSLICTLSNEGKELSRLEMPAEKMDTGFNISTATTVGFRLHNATTPSNGNPSVIESFTCERYPDRTPYIIRSLGPHPIAHYSNTSQRLCLVSGSGWNDQFERTNRVGSYAIMPQNGRRWTMANHTSTYGGLSRLAAGSGRTLQVSSGLIALDNFDAGISLGKASALYTYDTTNQTTDLIELGVIGRMSYSAAIGTTADANLTFVEAVIQRGSPYHLRIRTVVNKTPAEVVSTVLPGTGNDYWVSGQTYRIDLLIRNNSGTIEAMGIVTRGDGSSVSTAWGNVNAVAAGTRWGIKMYQVYNTSGLIPGTRLEEYAAWDYLAPIWRNTRQLLRLTPGNQFRDTTQRFRLKLAGEITAYRDSHLRLVLPNFRNITIRLRVRARIFKDSTLRLRLQQPSIEDTFTRSNTSSTLGIYNIVLPWSDRAGTWQINNNRALVERGHTPIGGIATNTPTAFFHDLETNFIWDGLNTSRAGIVSYWSSLNSLIAAVVEETSDPNLPADLAVNAEAYASHNETSSVTFARVASNVVDNAPYTYWRATVTADAYLVITLPETTTIKRVVLWQGSFMGNVTTNDNINSFTIRVSTSATDLTPANYTTVFTGTTVSSDAIKVCDFSAVSARRVMIYVNSNHGGTGIALTECQIYTAQGVQNLLQLGVTSSLVSTTSNAGTNYEGYRVLDGSVNSGPMAEANRQSLWSTSTTAFSSGVGSQSITLDMGSAKDFNHVRIWNPSTNGTNLQPVTRSIKDFTIHGSPDNAGYTQIASWQGAQNNLFIDVPFSTIQNYRYIRITITSNYETSGSTPSGISELEVYNVPNSTVTFRLTQAIGSNTSEASLSNLVAPVTGVTLVHGKSYVLRLRANGSSLSSTLDAAGTIPLSATTTLTPTTTSGLLAESHDGGSRYAPGIHFRNYLAYANRTWIPISQRFRPDKRGHRHSALRLSLGPLFRDSRVRFPLGIYRNTTQRFRLTAPILKDSAIRLRIASRQYRIAQQRLPIISYVKKDVTVRFRPDKRGHRHSLQRLYLGETVWKDSTLRIRIRATIYRNVASRLALGPLFQNSIARFRLGIYKNSRQRLVLGSSETRSVSQRFRVRLRVLSYRDMTIRLRMRARAYSDSRTRIHLADI